VDEEAAPAPADVAQEDEVQEDEKEVHEDKEELEEDQEELQEDEAESAAEESPAAAEEEEVSVEHAAAAKRTRSGEPSECGWRCLCLSAEESE